MMGMIITSGKEDIGYQGQAAQQATVLSLIHVSAARVSYIIHHTYNIHNLPPHSQLDKGTSFLTPQFIPSPRFSVGRGGPGHRTGILMEISAVRI